MNKYDRGTLAERTVEESRAADSSAIMYALERCSSNDELDKERHGKHIISYIRDIDDSSRENVELIRRIMNSAIHITETTRISLTKKDLEKIVAICDAQIQTLEENKDPKNKEKHLLYIVQKGQFEDYKTKAQGLLQTLTNTISYENLAENGEEEPRCIQYNDAIEILRRTNKLYAKLVKGDRRSATKKKIIKAYQKISLFFNDYKGPCNSGVHDLVQRARIRLIEIKHGNPYKKGQTHIKTYHAINITRRKLFK